MIRLWRWLFPRHNLNPIEDEVAGELRQARQRLESSTRLVEAKAEQTAKHARATTHAYRCRIEEKRKELQAAEEALDLLRGHHAPE